MELLLLGLQTCGKTPCGSTGRYTHPVCSVCFVLNTLLHVYYFAENLVEVLVATELLLDRSSKRACRRRCRRTRPPCTQSEMSFYEQKIVVLLIFFHVMYISTTTTQLLPFGMWFYFLAFSCVVLPYFLLYDIHVQSLILVFIKLNITY